jgi:hypothetical protein
MEQAKIPFNHFELLQGFMKYTANLTKSNRYITGSFPNSILFFGVFFALFISGCESPKNKLQQAHPLSKSPNMDFTKITSPIDVIAGISKAQPGDLVGPGSANNLLTSVSQIEPIRAYLSLSEQQYLQYARVMDSMFINHLQFL